MDLADRHVAPQCRCQPTAGDAIISRLRLPWRDTWTCGWKSATRIGTSARVRTSTGLLYLDCPLYSKKRGFFCTPASFLSRFFLRRSWKEEANSRGVCVVHEGGSWEPQRLRAPWESGPGERSLLLRVTRESVDARKLLHGGGEEGKGDGAKVGRWFGPRQTRYR